ncbi:hypothetical protein PGIGA_G00006320 [Pangasianodon gigas]|uniref:Uncharacterized protein n=1 Tax=Pangasianodon gigas TaxID=30993 RepID=A0ACC5W6J5_PANGG|nr:hypothetical protein [Pangasianodon gigas]
MFNHAREREREREREQRALTGCRVREAHARRRTHVILRRHPPLSASEPHSPAQSACSTHCSECNGSELTAVLQPDARTRANTEPTSERGGAGAGMNTPALFCLSTVDR